MNRKGVHVPFAVLLFLAINSYFLSCRDFLCYDYYDLILSG